MTFIADKLNRHHARVNESLLRRVRTFDYNNFERVVNDVTRRVTSSPSQQLAIARALGLNTQGLVIGGVRDASPVPFYTPAPSIAQNTPYIAPVKGVQVLPGNTKSPYAPPPTSGTGSGIPNAPAAPASSPNPAITPI